jgi:hypothetical protein
VSVQAVLLPVFVLVGLVFALGFWMGAVRNKALASGQARAKDVALNGSSWPEHTAQVGNCFRNQFEVPVLFYVLVAIALPLRHADLVFVLLSWVFVLTRYVHAGVFTTSNNMKQRFLAYLSGVLVLLAMWIYFALRILLLI